MAKNKSPQREILRTKNEIFFNCTKLFSTLISYRMTIEISVAIIRYTCTYKGKHVIEYTFDQINAEI